MNIAIDIRCLMERELTGVGEYTFHLLKHLFEIDNKNQYYLFYNSRQDVSQYVPKFPKDNVHYCRFHWPNKLLNFCLTFLKRPRLDKWIEKKFNIQQIDFFFFPNLSPLVVDCPYIITAHDLSFEFFPEFLSFKRKLWHWLVKPNKTFRRAEKVIAVSDNTRTDLIDYYGIRPQKVERIYSGVSANYKTLNGTGIERELNENYTTNEQQFKKIRKKYGLPRKFVLYLGTIEPRKNIDTLIDAFIAFKKETASDLSLVIAGKLGWKYEKESIKARKHESIQFTGFVLDKEKRYFYNLAECFVFPSYYEGFGFPTLEAMACGCPVITSANSSLAEICGEAAILINPININDIKEALKEIIKPETRKHYVELGLQHYKKFNWYKTAEELRQMFNQVKIN